MSRRPYPEIEGFSAEALTFTDLVEGVVLVRRGKRE